MHLFDIFVNFEKQHFLLGSLFTQILQFAHKFLARGVEFGDLLLKIGFVLVEIAQLSANFVHSAGVHFAFVCGSLFDCLSYSVRLSVVLGDFGVVFGYFNRAGIKFGGKSFGGHFTRFNVVFHCYALHFLCRKFFRQLVATAF